jgi:hypothetical protein
MLLTCSHLALMNMELHSQCWNSRSLYTPLTLSAPAGSAPSRNRAAARAVSRCHVVRQFVQKSKPEEKASTVSCFHSGWWRAMTYSCLLQLPKRSSVAASRHSMICSIVSSEKHLMEPNPASRRQTAEPCPSAMIRLPHGLRPRGWPPVPRRVWDMGSGMEEG